MASLRRLVPVFAVRMGEAGLRYAFNGALALSLGVAGAGQVYVALAVIGLLACLARGGLDNVAVRRVAVAVAEGDWAGARGVAAAALGHAALVGAGLSLLLALAVPWLVPGYPDVLRAMAGGGMALALLALTGGLLAALGRPVAGQVVTALCWPALATAGLMLGLATPVAVGLATVAAMAAMAAIGALLLWRALGRGPLCRADHRALLTAAWPFFGVEAVQLLAQTLPLIALGLLASDREAGLFGLASRVAMLVTVLTTATYAVTAPRLARCHAAGDLPGLRRALHEGSRGVCLLGLPLVLGLLAAPAWVMGLFGVEFHAAAPVLVAASLGQVANLFFSQGHTLLAMAGQERALLRVSLLALGVMLLALALLMQGLGALGAAIAVAIGGWVMGVGQAIVARRALGLHVLEAFLPPRPRSATP